MIRTWNLEPEKPGMGCARPVAVVVEAEAEKQRPDQTGSQDCG